MIKACVFDMDGTVSDTIESIAYFGNNALKKYGLNGIDTEQYKIMVGNGAAILVRRMVNANGCTDEDTYQKVLKEYNSTYDADFLYLTKPYDGILELLDALRERGVLTAVLSNKPHGTTLKVADALFGDRFDVVIGQREGKPIKPDPTVLKEILADWHISPDECFYIGDTGTDMQTGKGGDCFTIGVLWGFRGQPELIENGADAIVSHPSEILTLLEKAAGVV